MNRCPARNGDLICIRLEGHSTNFFPPDGHNWQPSLERLSNDDSLRQHPIPSYPSASQLKPEDLSGLRQGIHAEDGVAAIRPSGVQGITVQVSESCDAGTNRDASVKAASVSPKDESIQELMTESADVATLTDDTEAAFAIRRLLRQLRLMLRDSAASGSPQPEEQRIAAAILSRVTVKGRNPLSVSWDFGHGQSVASSGGDETKVWDGLLMEVGFLVDATRRRAENAEAALASQPEGWQPATTFIDCLMSDRLRRWAKNILEPGGNDIWQWGDKYFVAERMLEIADGIDAVIKASPEPAAPSGPHKPPSEPEGWAAELYLCSCCSAPVCPTITSGVLDGGTTWTCPECGGKTVVSLSACEPPPPAGEPK